ncbi:MAG TPA: hypothetical protein VH879_10510 [Gemmatimonadales bacterium]|jgi:hypothetical protein
MSKRIAFLIPAVIVSAAVSVACSDSEAPAEDHTPVRFDVAVNLDTVTGPVDTLRLPAGPSDSVVIIFYNAGDENLDHAEAEHYSLLTFYEADGVTVATGITSTMDPSHHFRHKVDLTAPAGTKGHLVIGFGHDALADENAFDLGYSIE